MSHVASQNLKNHARWVPFFHFVAGPILLVNLVYSIVLAIRIPIWDNIDGALVGLALVLLFVAARKLCHQASGPHDSPGRAGPLRTTLPG